MKNTLKEINSRLNYAEKQISDLETRIVKNHTIRTTKRKKELKKNEDSFRDF